VGLSVSLTVPPPQRAPLPVTVLQAGRVTLRDWVDEDLAPFAALNADPEVMAHFPARLSRDDSDAAAGRIRRGLAERGWGLWALQTPELRFAGFVGLVPVGFELPAGLLPWGDVPPVVEIGWRLSRAAWGRGDASAAARLALAHARDALHLPGLVSFTALANRRSEAVMQRLGLQRLGEFDHPRVPADHPVCRHVLYGLGFAAPAQPPMPT